MFSWTPAVRHTPLLNPQILYIGGIPISNHLQFYRTSWRTRRSLACRDVRSLSKEPKSPREFRGGGGKKKQKKSNGSA